MDVPSRVAAAGGHVFRELTTGLLRPIPRHQILAHALCADEAGPLNSGRWIDALPATGSLGAPCGSGRSARGRSQGRGRAPTGGADRSRDQGGTFRGFDRFIASHFRHSSAGHPNRPAQTRAGRQACCPCRLSKRSHPRRPLRPPEAGFLRRGVRGGVSPEARAPGGSGLGVRPVGARSASGPGVLHQGACHGPAEHRFPHWAGLLHGAGRKGDRSSWPERPEGCFAPTGPVPFSRAGGSDLGIALEGAARGPGGGRSVDRLYALRQPAQCLGALPPRLGLRRPDRRSDLSRAGARPGGVPSDEAGRAVGPLAAEIRLPPVDRDPPAPGARPDQAVQGGGDLHRRRLRPTYDGTEEEGPGVGVYRHHPAAVRGHRRRSAGGRAPVLGADGEVGRRPPQGRPISKRTRWRSSTSGSSATRRATRSTAGRSSSTPRPRPSASSRTRTGPW